MAVHTSFVRHVFQGFFAGLFDVVPTDEVMYKKVLASLVCLGEDMGKVLLFFRWKMAIHAFGAEANFVGTMCGKFPAPVGGPHFVAPTAAKPRLRCRFHCSIDSNKAEYGKDESHKKRQRPLLNSFIYPANYSGPKFKHARNLLTFQSNARLFSIPTVKCSKVFNFRFTIF